MLNRSATKDVFEQLLQEDRFNVGLHDEDAAEVAEALLPDDEDADEAEVAEALNPDGDVEHTATSRRETSRRRRWLRRIGALVGALLFVAAAGLAGFFGWQLKRHNDVAAAGHTALDIATTYAVTLTSIDNQKIDEDFARVLDGATGEFKDMYSQSSTQLRQLLVDNKAVSHGTVIDAAVKSATKDKVEVLIFVDQSISNSVNPDPRVDRSRIGMTMERVDGRWLASKVDIK